MATKYRYWDIEKKRMVYQDRENFSVRLREKKDGNEIYVDRKTYIDNLFTPEMAVLMQCINIRSSESQEIYEGDIVTNGELKAMVQYVDTEFCAMANEKKSECMINLLWGGHTKVIGNKYENPQLLKGVNI